MNTDRYKAKGIKAWNTGENSAKTSKYSSNLIAVPTGSLSLINPEKMNKQPTIILQV
jgi:hypothetical protein